MYDVGAIILHIFGILRTRGLKTVEKNIPEHKLKTIFFSWKHCKIIILLKHNMRKYFVVFYFFCKAFILGFDLKSWPHSALVSLLTVPKRDHWGPPSWLLNIQPKTNFSVVCSFGYSVRNRTRTCGSGFWWLTIFLKSAFLVNRCDLFTSLKKTAWLNMTLSKHVKSRNVAAEKTALIENGKHVSLLQKKRNKTMPFNKRRSMIWKIIFLNT